MLREMDLATEDSDLLLELIEDFLSYSQTVVMDIERSAQQEDGQVLATAAHSLKGASLNIGALVLFQVCDKIELLARKKEVELAKEQLPTLTYAFQATATALVELRERTYRGEMIDDLLSDNLLA
jgi:HPt (histidine-containing phosphotransfer) domain-containing protein